MSWNDFTGYIMGAGVIVVYLFFYYRNRGKALDSIVREERPLPSLRKGLTVLRIISYFLVAILIFWLGFGHRVGWLSHPLVFLLAIAFVLILLNIARYLYLHHRRCPECGNRLVLRRGPVRGNKWRHRMLLDCSRCQIAWDTGDIDDQSSAS
jgi:hypothetical protein